MTLFEALIAAALSALTTFLPLGQDAHLHLWSAISGFNELDPRMAGWFAFCSLIALVLHFRHDWAGMISGLLTVLLTRKAPRTLDERVPLFVVIAWLPTFAAGFALKLWPIETLTSPTSAAIGLFAGGAALFGAERWSRRQKNYWDWSLVDSLLVGLFAATSVLPGIGWMTALLIFASLWNFRPDGIWKFALYGLLPVLALQGIPAARMLDLGAGFPLEGVNWLSFGLSGALCLALSWMILNAITSTLSHRSTSGFAVYRMLAGVGTLGYLLWSGGA